MPKYTKAELHKIIDENDIKFLRLQFTDIFGILKNITVMTSKLDSIIAVSYTHLDVYKRQALF